MDSILILLVFLGFCYCERYPRNVTKVLSVNNPVHSVYGGSWHGPQFCGHGMYATGFELKIETDQHIGDDSGLNAILLSCSYLEDQSIFGGFIESGEGPSGSFGEWKRCATDEFLVGFELNIEKHSLNLDHKAAINARFRCRTYDGGKETKLSHPFVDHEDRWGVWTGYSGSCQNGSAICGIKTKVDYRNGYGRVGLIDAHFFCCGSD